VYKKLLIEETDFNKAKAGYVTDIEKVTVNNNNFRHVLFTGKHSQLVVMNLKPSEEIGDEIHKGIDQFFRIAKGSAKLVLNEKETHILNNGDCFIVPAGTYHNVINNSTTSPLKVYTVYSPPKHKDGLVQKTKADAMKSKE
jgi:mannose-6-phosphate isomerase-like protein (cupin superfamily)